MLRVEWPFRRDLNIVRLKPHRQWKLSMYSRPLSRLHMFILRSRNRQTVSSRDITAIFPEAMFRRINFICVAPLDPYFNDVS